MESLRYEKDAAVQKAIQRSTDEIEQLKKTSAQLREELESQTFEYDKKLQKQTLDKIAEHRHMQETIEKLREELDKKHG